jgi:hypothetical protein
MSDATVGERAVELLTENGYGPREQIEGCTEAELKSLERRYNVTLPEAYKSCMRHIGRSNGGFLSGSKFSYPAVELQTEFAREIAAENATNFEFPEDAFVFCGLQGYAFDCFRTEEGEDPPVYLFMNFEPESGGNGYELRRESGSFSEWLFKEIESQSAPDL